MDDHRFDALTRFVATSRTRRQLLQAVGGSLVAAFAASSRAAAASCADRCTRLPDAAGRAQCVAACAAAEQAGTDAEAARATATALRACIGAGGQLCGSGIDVVCCTADETCQDGQCTGGDTGPGPCQPEGAACTADGDCCSGGCSNGICCPAGSRGCDGACYPGGCCADADCGDPCQVCDLTSHTCQDCPSGCDPRVGCCTPTTCQSGQCGSIPDGCGGTLDCGGCDANECQLCIDNACVSACDEKDVCYQHRCCTPAACAPGQCGSQPDQCGGTVDCGSCPTGQTCHQGTCCTLAICQPESHECGIVPDNCGGTLDCGGCDASKCEHCVGNVCVSTCVGHQICYQGSCCTPATCKPGQCGKVDDGCGGTIDCGCPAGQVCHEGTCCTPTCGFNSTCGGSDGCGGTCGGMDAPCWRDENCCNEGTCIASGCCTAVCGVVNTICCPPGDHVCVNGGCFLKTEYDQSSRTCTACPSCSCSPLYEGGQRVCITDPPPFKVTECYADGDCLTALGEGYACIAISSNPSLYGICVSTCGGS